MDAPALAVGERETAVAWMDRREPGPAGAQVWLARRGARGAGAGPETALPAEGTGDQRRPTVALTVSGRLVAAWTDDRSGRPAVVARGPDGVERPVSGSGEGACDVARVAVAGETAWVAYEAQAGGRERRALLRRLP